MAHIGMTVNRLIRTSYGPFRLNEMKPGKVEEIKPKILREQLGMTEADIPTPPRPGRFPDVKPAAKPVSRTRRDSDDDAAKTSAKPAAKRPLKPGEGLKQLSEAWKTATRPASGGAKTGPARPRSPARPAPKPAPKPGGPKRG